MTYPTKPDVERLLLTLLRGTGVLPQILNEVVKKIVDQETIKQFLDQEDGTVEKAIGLAFQAYQNLPKKTSNVLGGVVSGVLLAAEYGLFLCIWNYFEIIIENLIMRELRLTSQETSILCGGLGFANKVHVLYSLLGRDEKNKKGIELLKTTHTFSGTK